MRKVGGIWRTVSVYGEDVWWPTGAPTNANTSNTKIDFATVPSTLRAVAKEMMYRYLRRGRAGGKPPRATTLVRGFKGIASFLQYAHTLGVATLREISPLICSNYVQLMRDKRTKAGKPLALATLYKLIRSVSDVFELSQYTDDAMVNHPWPDSSADHLSGYSKGKRNKQSGITPLIPDDIFVSLFQAAWSIVQDGPRLLDLRDELESVAEKKRGLHPKYVSQFKTKALVDSGFKGSYPNFIRQLLDIRTACYVVIASLSGCRNHELANLHSDSCYSSEDDDGEQFWWMCSKSEKTFEGNTEWMIPEAAVVALRLLERWAEPFQEILRREIDGYRQADAGDIRIAEAEDHLNALLVGIDKRNGNVVRTIGIQTLNSDLKTFAQACGISWSLASHQFRRKFANYAARSQFGDLRYLKEHYKHWSMDMTLGYALNESQELALYLEIQDELDEIKQGVVETWLDDSEPLAGGYGARIVDWRSRGENVTLFKNRDAMVRSIAESTAIRSNGHAWCTAGDNLCAGNDLEPTRCGDNCENAVIGRQHSEIYQGIYSHTKELQTLEDIGPGGRERVNRDVDRCAAVLAKLGYEVQEGAA
jgi:hypothetical protein